MRQLKGSVGAAGRNRPDDIGAVQRLLAAAGHSPGLIDQRCGRHTVSAIVSFQEGFLRRPDGRVDVGGPTWCHLSAGADGQAHFAHAPASRTPTGVLSPFASPVARRIAPPAHPSAPSQHPAAAPASHAARPAPGGSALNYREKLPLPPPASINVGLHSPGNAEMLRRFGEPRQSYGTDCQPPTNERLKKSLTSMQFGVTRVHGLAPAVASLQAVLADIQRELPDLMPHLGSAGMMCCRYQRGSNHAITNHSWGTAIDVSIDGRPEPFGERDVYLGLSLIGPVFNRHGWYWGAGYHRVTDCHHFECGSALLDTLTI